MRHVHLIALASASALGITATAAELSRGRLMRAPNHDGDGPAWFYGPKGAAQVIQPGEAIPSGFEDHPSKVGGEAGGGVHTAKTSANGPVSESTVAKSTTAKSQTHTDPATAAKAGVGGAGNTLATGDTASQKTDQASGNTAEIDAHGHPFDANLHAATRSKTKDGLWRLKVGGKRPDPLPGYPKPPKLDL